MDVTRRNGLEYQVMLAMSVKLMPAKNVVLQLAPALLLLAMAPDVYCLPTMKQSVTDAHTDDTKAVLALPVLETFHDP